MPGGGVDDTRSRSSSRSQQIYSKLSWTFLNVWPSRSDKAWTGESHPQWMDSPIVVSKRMGDCICRVFKVLIVNQASAMDQYHPHQIAGGQNFSNLAYQVYLQLLLDAESGKYLTINTHLVLCHHSWLPGFGTGKYATLRQYSSIVTGVTTSGPLGFSGSASHWWAHE